MVAPLWLRVLFHHGCGRRRVVVVTVLLLSTVASAVVVAGLARCVELMLQQDLHVVALWGLEVGACTPCCDGVVTGPARRDGVAVTVTVDSRLVKGTGSDHGFAYRRGGDGGDLRGAAWGAFLASAGEIDVIRGQLAARDMDSVRNKMKPKKKIHMLITGLKPTSS